MEKVTLRKFTGSWFRVYFLCATILGIPAAIIYIIESTVGIQHEVDDAEEFLKHH